MTPGIWVQKITTRQPTDDMIEVAIVSMEQALAADGEAIPDGSAAFEREPLGEAEARFKARTRRPTRRPSRAAPAAPRPVTARRRSVGGQLPVPVETERPAPGA